MITCLKGFAENFKHKKNWGDIWSLDGLYLNDAQARIFVSKAIEAAREQGWEMPAKSPFRDVCPQCLKGRGK